MRPLIFYGTLCDHLGLHDNIPMTIVIKAHRRCKRMVELLCEALNFRHSNFIVLLTTLDSSTLRTSAALASRTRPDWSEIVNRLEMESFVTKLSLTKGMKLGYTGYTNLVTKYDNPFITRRTTGWVTKNRTHASRITWIRRKHQLILDRCFLLTV